MQMSRICRRAMLPPRPFGGRPLPSARPEASKSAHRACCDRATSGGQRSGASVGPHALLGPLKRRTHSPVQRLLLRQRRRRRRRGGRRPQQRRQLGPRAQQRRRRPGEARPRRAGRALCAARLRRSIGRMLDPSRGVLRTRPPRRRLRHQHSRSRRVLHSSIVGRVGFRPLHRRRRAEGSELKAWARAQPKVQARACASAAACSVRRRQRRA